MTVKKRHHTVARFYLEQFALPGQCLWQYSRDGSPPKAVQPSDATVGKRFYSVRGADGEWNNQIEDILSDIESDAAPAIRDLAEGKALLGRRRAAVAMLISAQFERGFATKAHAEMEAKRLKDVDELERFVRASEKDIRKRFSQKEIDDFLAERQNTKEGLTVDPKFYLPEILKKVPERASVIGKMQWRVERHDQGMQFVTSDNPAFTRRRGHDLDVGIVGFDREDLNVELTFPISRHAVLIAGWRHPRRRSARIGRLRVRELNRRAVLSAHKYVYSPLRSEHIESLVREHVGFQLKWIPLQF